MDAPIRYPAQLRQWLKTTTMVRILDIDRFWGNQNQPDSL
jgi:hypothetical protein